MKMQKQVFVTLILGLFLPLSYIFAGTIDTSYKYAWSDNVGYINFEHLVVNDTSISGYAWSANSGWIKFNPAVGGVSNNSHGVLSGSAWGENLGWIDFSGVSINPTTGQFSGHATGETVGTITFNSNECSYCIVRTDWREPATVTVNNGGGAVGLSFLSSPSLTTNITLQKIAEAINKNFDLFAPQIPLNDNQSPTPPIQPKKVSIVIQGEKKPLTFFEKVKNLADPVFPIISFGTNIAQKESFFVIVKNKVSFKKEVQVGPILSKNTLFRNVKNLVKPPVIKKVIPWYNINIWIWKR